MRCRIEVGEDFGTVGGSSPGPVGVSKGDLSRNYVDSVGGREQERVPVEFSVRGRITDRPLWPSDNRLSQVSHLETPYDGINHRQQRLTQ